MKLKTLTHAEADGIVTVKAGYEMPGVQATLEIEYAVDNTGAVTIAQSLKLYQASLYEENGLKLARYSNPPKTNTSS